jgi:hypothetical protein
MIVLKKGWRWPGGNLTGRKGWRIIAPYSKKERKGLIEGYVKKIQLNLPQGMCYSGFTGHRSSAP